MTDQRPVLLLSGNHTMQGLWRPLSEHFDLCVVNQQQAAVAVETGVTGAFPLGKYMNAEVQEHAVNMSYRVASAILEKENQDRLNIVIERAFDGKNIPDSLQSPYVNEWWAGFVGEHVRNEVALITLVDKLAQERRVVGCIVHEDVTPDMRALVRTCQSKGIPTIHIPHANCFYVGDEWDIHTESISDYICASGTYMRDWYTRWGYPEDKIVITGAPQWDSYFAGNNPSREEARRVLGIKTLDEFVLIYATTWGQLTSNLGGVANEDIHDNLRMVSETAKELNATVVIKMHPGEAQGNEQGYVNVLKEKGINGMVTRQFNEYVLAAGDCLVSHAPSNLCCQAAFVGLPCAYIPVDGYAFPEPGPVTVRGNMTWAVKMARQVKNTWENFAESMNSAYPNGGACDRIAEEVVRICL